MPDDAMYVEIAENFKVVSAGRVDLWRECIEQGRPLVDAARALTPVSSNRDVDPVGTSVSDAAGFVVEPPTGPYSWDRHDGETCTARVEQALARIEANEHLNAFTRVFPREALAEASALDARLSQGESIGPFGGAIVAVKDIVGVRDVPISGGTRAYQATPGDDALVVARLRAAGGIIIGTANMHALAYGPFSTSTDYGPVRNPLNTTVVAGGSSGGSAAAVAAGLADIAVGTDTAGSIRMPAALCGVVGLKPTYACVPALGAQPLAASLDHIGPLARTVSDAHAALNAMLGVQGQEGSRRQKRREDLPLAGMTIGLLDSYVEDGLAVPIRMSFEQAKELLQKLGARIKVVRLPTLAAAPGMMLCTLGPEAFHTFNDLLTHRASLLPEDVRRRLETGMFLAESDYAHCQLLRQDLRREVDNAFDEVDTIMTPTMAVTAPLIAEVEGAVRFQGSMNLLTLPFNLTGHPALTLPFALDDRGAGIGIQLVGKRHADSSLLALAGVIEAHTGCFASVPER